MPTITPTIADITVNATTWHHSDFEANPLGTFAEVANAVGTQLQALGDTTGSIVKVISGDTTLSGPESVNLTFIFTGTLSAAAAITFPAGERMAVIVNNTDGGYGLTVGLATGDTVAIPVSGSAVVYCDGTDFVLADGIVRTATGASVTGTFDLSGAAAFASTLAVAGAVTMSADATVDDTLTVGGDTTLNGALTVQGITAIYGATTIQDTLNVELNSAFLANLGVGGDLGVTGDIICSSDIVGATLAARHDTNSVIVYADSPDGTAATIAYRTASVQRWGMGKGTDNDFGLAWYDASGVYQSHIFIVDEATGNLRLFNLPTSSSGLDSGTVWNSSGTLMIA